MVVSIVSWLFTTGEGTMVLIVLGVLSWGLFAGIVDTRNQRKRK